MNTQQFSESSFLNAELIEQSQTKKGYIMGDATVSMGQYGERLEVPIELDGKKKTWTLTRDNVKSLHQFGVDSKSWIGKWVEFKVINVMGKKSVLAIPMTQVEEKVN